MQVSEIKKDKVVACKLTTPDLQKHKSEVIASLKTKVIEKKEISNGYQYSFGGSDAMIDEIISFIKAERACCGFFTFELSVGDNKSDILLTITGPEGAKEFIHSEMDF